MEDELPREDQFLEASISRTTMIRYLFVTALLFICAIGRMPFVHAAQVETEAAKEAETEVSRIEVFDELDKKPVVTSRAEEIFSIDSAATEIKRLSDLIISKIKSSEKEIANARKQVQRRYAAQVEAVKRSPQDEFETVAQLKTRKVQQLMEHARDRDAELAKAEGIRPVVLAEIEALYLRIKSLDEREYVLGGESVASELGRYNADQRKFPVSLHSKTRSVKLEFKGIIPLPVEQAKLFKQQWHAGLIRPEVKTRLGRNKLELALINHADNTRLTLHGTMFLTPEMLVSEEAAAKLIGEMIPIPGRDFEIGRTEVTQQQWQAVIGKNPSRFKGDNLPVDTVSWNDVQLYLSKLNEMTGKQYRLPTEAEWVFACYGGKKTKYCGSDNLDDVAWYDDNSASRTRPVGGKKASAYGLYDMTGNVREWVRDGDKGRRVLLGGRGTAPQSTCEATIAASMNRRTATTIAAYAWPERCLRFLDVGYPKARTTASLQCTNRLPSTIQVGSGDEWSDSLCCNCGR